MSVWLLIGFLKAVPRDIEEQAMVDGYSRLGAFWRAVVPLTFPGIVAVVVFAFTLTASEFIYALSFVSPTQEKVISTGVPTELVRGDVFFWQSLQAATVLVARADRAGVQPVPRPLRRRLHPGRGQGLTGCFPIPSRRYRLIRSVRHG